MRPGRGRGPGACSRSGARGRRANRRRRSGRTPSRRSGPAAGRSPRPRPAESRVSKPSTPWTWTSMNPATSGVAVQIDEAAAGAAGTGRARPRLNLRDPAVLDDHRARRQDTVGQHHVGAAQDQRAGEGRPRGHARQSSPFGGPAPRAGRHARRPAGSIIRGGSHHVDPVTLSALAVVALVLVLAVPAFVVWRKGRPAASGEVFRASRLSGGNRLFPTQVIVTPHSVVHYTPQWIGQARALDPHRPRVLGADRHRADVLGRRHRDHRRLRGDPLPRPSQGRRRPHQAAHRAVPERLLPRRRGPGAAPGRAAGDRESPACGPASVPDVLTLPVRSVVATTPLDAPHPTRSRHAAVRVPGRPGGADRHARPDRAPALLDRLVAG